MTNNNATELIIEKAKQLFFSYGLKSVSMDDIAKQSGLSKKTLYELFNHKNDIVFTVVGKLMRSHEELLITAHSTAHDAIDEVLKQDAGLSLFCKGLRPRFFYELEKFYPQAWAEVEKYKLKIYDTISENLYKGQEEGVYRKDIDRKLIADLRLHQLVNVLKPKLLTSINLSVKQLADEYTVLYMHAITTERGKKLFDNYLNENRSADSGHQG
jgi:AcrR family transcriptional regulator